MSRIPKWSRLTQSKFARAILIALLLSGTALGETNTWTKLDKATITGRRREPPLVYSPELGRFCVLGGLTYSGQYREPRPYDVLALDAKSNRWENAFPEGREWGPKFGPCKAPRWKGEVWGFRDAEGNVRPNWSVYGTFSLGSAYAHDAEGKRFVFYAGGSTFSYDPVKRVWADLAPATHPMKETGGKLLWASMAQDTASRQLILFGGGNVQSERGDPGTWVYSHAKNAWTRLALDEQPPQRANSQLVFDPVRKKVILFGGDQLDQLVADTWEFDPATTKWTRHSPPVGPSPRAGHALLWLPKSKRVLLVGGYGYASSTDYVGAFYRRLPLELWLYDPAAQRWQLLRRFAPGKDTPTGPSNGVLRAAINEAEELLVVADDGSTWTCKLDVEHLDASLTKLHGVKPGSVERRTGPYDPAWFAKDVPAADPKKVAATLADLPANRWVRLATPKLPRPNMDWGSAVFDSTNDLILRFSGGHSAYSGTAPIVYDIRTDRYSLPFTPEMPIEYIHSNDQVNGEWSFKGNPWMTGHTYKATGFDTNLSQMVFACHEYNYFFDPKVGKWSRSTERNPYAPNMYVVTLCSTPTGAVVWADKRGGDAGLWRLEKKVWVPIPIKGTLPAKSPDRHGMAFDSKRERFLLFSALDRNKGDVMSVDPKTGKTAWLGAAGKAKAAVASRETVYLPDQDAVLGGARVEVGGTWRWLLYDCKANAWKAVLFTGEDPIGKGSFNNSMGLMFDPKRKLVWAVGQNSHVHVMRVDLEKAEVAAVK